MTDRSVEYVPLSEVVPALVNPKQHRTDVLAASVDRFGFVEPVVMDERTGRLVAGHGRVETLAAMRSEGAEVPAGVQVVDGEWLVPVVRGWASTDDQDASAYLVASNRTTELGGWDDTELLGLLEGLGSAGLPGTGYDTDDLAGLLESVAVPPFEPVDADAQPRLDVRNPVVCPACGHHFHRA